MYRDSTASLAETIAKLETELYDLRALRSRPLVGAYVLVAVVAISVLCAIASAASLTAALGRVHELERLYSQARTEAVHARARAEQAAQAAIESSAPAASELPGSPDETP